MISYPRHMLNKKLINALQIAIRQLKAGAPYEWGHVGRCNCGHLVQALVGISAGEIYRNFGQELDEWSEHSRDYCGVSGKPVEELFEELRRVGFSAEDVHHLEYLSDPKVLRALPGGFRHLRRNNRDDLILYMETLVVLVAKEPSLEVPFKFQRATKKEPTKKAA
jgi:hypothetical protein